MNTAFALSCAPTKEAPDQYEGRRAVAVIPGLAAR